MNYTKFLIYLILSSDEYLKFAAQSPVWNAEEIIQNKIETQEKIFLNEIFRSNSKEEKNVEVFEPDEYVQIKKTSEYSYEYFQRCRFLSCYGILHKFNEHWFDLFICSDSEKDDLNNLSSDTFNSYKSIGFSSQIILFDKVPLEAENAVYYNNFFKEPDPLSNPTINLVFHDLIKYSTYEKNNLISISPELEDYKKTFKKEFSKDDLNRLNSNLSNLIFDFFDRRKLKLHLILN